MSTTEAPKEAYTTRAGGMRRLPQLEDEPIGPYFGQNALEFINREIVRSNLNRLIGTVTPSAHATLTTYAHRHYQSSLKSNSSVGFWHGDEPLMTGADTHWPDVEKFNRLKAQWLHERPRSSKMRDILLAMPYQQIIGMGQRALPLLFMELRREPNHWFWALEAITCENPIPQDAFGDIARMTEAWLQWANENGF